VEQTTRFKGGHDSYDDDDIADAIINALDYNDQSYDDKKVDELLDNLPW